MTSSNNSFLKPYYYESLEKIITDLSNQQRYEAAAVFTARLIHHFKGNLDYLLLHAKILRKIGLVREALDTVVRALKIDPDFTALHIEFTETMLALDCPEDALRALNVSIFALACCPTGDKSRARDLSKIRELVSAMGLETKYQEYLSIVEENIENGQRYEEQLRKLRELAQQ